MDVRLTQIDGKLPNLALMKLAAYHRSLGHGLHFTKHIDRGLMESRYGRVYGSAIFSFSRERVERFKRQFPDAVVGGTWNTSDPTTVEDYIARTQTAEEATGTELGEVYDYSIYPNFTGSIGFTARGCRFKCGYCVVPGKEGKPRVVNTIASIYRGAPWPKHIYLLDNDFFGQPEDSWRARIEEIRAGGFKVCFNQGINIRMINEDSAAALASVQYYDDAFKTRRLYTAWDNLNDEARFLRGVETLGRYGIPPTHLLVYMLVGYDRRETWERLFYRFNKMAALGIRPYPMVFENRMKTLPLGGCNQRIEHRTLGEFQRWVIRKAYTFVSFENYNVNAKGHLPQGQLSFATMN